MFQSIVFFSFILLLTTTLNIFAGVISSPLVHIGSFNVSTSQQTSQCKWSIFVRADDLRIGQLTSGDVRLINNMTNINNTDECEIVRWSLILRSNENAAMRYPMPLIELPKEPKYNYTWDRYRHSVTGFLNGGSSLNDESGLFIFDPYKEEREEYDRKLEEYATAIRTKDHFVIQRIEKTHFEISLDMGKVEEPIEEYQMTPLEPFAVSLPASMQGPYDFKVKRISYFDEKTNERKANLTYRQDSSLRYLAKITLRNGTEVELEAGDASFIPSRPRISTPLPTSIKVDEEKSMSWAANRVGLISLDGDDENKEKILFPGLNATINFDQVPQLKQGNKIVLNGTIKSTNTSYEIVSISVKLENRVEPKWALDVLKSDNRPELYEELKKRADYLNDDGFKIFYTDERASASVTIPQTAVSFFEKEKSRIEKDDHESGCDKSCRLSCSATRGSPAKGASDIDEDGSFSVWLNVSDTAAVSPMDTSISHIHSRLSFVLGIRLAEQNEGEDEGISTQQDSSLRIQAVREALSDWPSSRFSIFQRCAKDINKGKKNRQQSAEFFLKQAIGEVSISPKQWQKYDRDAKVIEESCVSNRIPPSSNLGPKLIRLNDINDDQEYELHRQQACQSDPIAFPNLSQVSKMILKSSAPSQDSNVEKIDSMEFGKYKRNRFERCHTNLMDLTRRFIAPGTCDFHTGEVWAKKLFDQFKLHQPLEQNTYSANQDESQPALQFQESL